ncbi:hypothetical protein FIBSPDRAFT_890108 [Athelia psychrophila]|uniref:Receptor-activated Ca2+-permeable cation channel n=1 Tax=Athelia psychrophila TaxID=1759441 RepID=A0A166LAR0_9AGAM|nr:hypothetical protein FIBSPDRAFT_890108 [Fibularhizoctonia sp. CBS 109695]
MDPEEQSSLLAPSREQLSSIKVFPLIPYLKQDAIRNIDSALTWEQLTTADITFSIIRPLVFKYARLDNMATVYACMVVRSYFLGEAESNLAYSGVNISRASLCEILAMKLLGYYAENKIHLVAGWEPLAGAPDAIAKEVRASMGSQDEPHDPQSALEMAVSTEAKAFLASPVVQSIVNDIYSGRVVFSTSGHRSMLADNYKPREIEIYDCTTAPFLNHYRLRVPRYQNILEFWNFSVLIVVLVLCLSNQDVNQINVWEGIFIAYATAFTLGEYTAANEHGWNIYIANMWNVFDASFTLVFVAFLVLRIKSLAQHDPGASELAFDLLACTACILFPRLAFFAVSNNMVVLALRAMIAEFVFFIAIAAICFSGLLFTLWTLASDRWSVRAIAWLMVQIWFGNTYLSFAQAESFHPFFGPILMTGFACLANTLLLTILISILSNTVARIDAYLFQHAITTIEGVNSDALFSYQPPFNLFAFLLLKPASWFLSPRALHSANVFLIKVSAFPILIIIGVYERHFALGQRLRESGKSAAQSFYNSLPRRIRHIPFLEAMVGSNSRDLYDAIFDVEVSHEFELFDGEGSDDELPALRLRRPSRENLAPNRSGRNGRSHTASPARRRNTSLRLEMPSGGGSPGPRSRKLSALSPLFESFSSTEVPALAGGKSPLTRLFSSRQSTPAAPEETISQNPNLAAESASTLKKMECLLDDMRDLPVQQLKDEMKELQDRQARIESLLLMLTQGMRNDTTPASSSS